MIDKAHVEQWQADLTDAVHVRTMSVELMKEINLLDLLTDYLALRAIVESLAERPAVQYVKAGTRDAHYVCSFCRRVNWNNQNIDHDESCLWAQARALVGPASGARTEAE